MKRRWKITLGLGVAGLVLALAPIVMVETRCRSPVAGEDAYQPLLTDRRWHRDEARTWLTYPEWHIVYSAQEFARFLRDRPPSAYPYLRDIGGFWSSLCAMNRASGGRADTATKVMLYTIGHSFSAELLVKASYENTLGRLSEWLGGWRSADDLYARKVQERYGAFLEQTPWYAFPFGDALAGLWRTRDKGSLLRHWERRLALSAEYGVKAGYAKLIGWASGASLGRDETTLRMLVQAGPDRIAAIDPRLRPVATMAGGLTLVEAPRYAPFTDIVRKLAAAGADPVEISGNDDVFVTLLMPPGAPPPARGEPLFAIPAGEPGWRRVGLSVKVRDLSEVVRSAAGSGGRLEHVYDY